MALATGAFAFAAHAQDNANSNQQQTASAPSYCDTQWIKVDGNEDGFVSREEASNAVSSQFGQIDLDGNGQITKTEWVDCMTRTQGQQSAKTDRSAENFAQADADQDKSMTRDEFRNASQQAFDESRSATDANAEPVIVLRRYVWLTPEESQDASSLQAMSEDEAAGRSVRTFNALDENGDKIIDDQEWSAQSAASGPSEDEANLSFNQIDKDSSNFIDAEEYQEARNDLIDATTTGSIQNSGSKSDAAQQNGTGMRPYVYHFWY